MRRVSSLLPRLSIAARSPLLAPRAALFSAMSTPPSSPTELRWDTRPDDLHHHLRDGDAALALTAAHVSAQFARCIVMPNLVPPVTTTEQALAYRERVVKSVPEARRAAFEPLMTLYMTDGTTPEEIRRAHATGKIFAVKLYPGKRGALIGSRRGYDASV